MFVQNIIQALFLLIKSHMMYVQENFKNIVD